MKRKSIAFMLVIMILCTTILIPVDAAVGDELIFTATEASENQLYTYSGSHTFQVSQTGALTTSGYYWGGSFGCWMQMSINVPTSYYKIYFYSPLAHEGNDANAVIEVTDGTGDTTSIPINLQTTQGWVELGNYSFINGTPTTVKVVNHTSGKNIRFDSIKLVDIGDKPVALNAKISGKGALYEPLSVSYQYEDGTNMPEGNTTFAWYQSDTEEGTYTQIAGATANSYTPTANDSNKFIKCKITPASTTEIGDEVETEPVQIRWKLDFMEDFNQPNPDGYEDEWISDNSAQGHILSGRYPENVTVSDGKLYLVSKKEEKNGQSWTSGSVKSKKDFHYGYYEASYKYAPATGLNQSFWIMTRTGNSQPNDYEIDINEGAWPNKVASNYHYYVGDTHMSDSESITYPGIDFGAEYHTFGCEWTDSEIIMYLDGEEYRRMENTTWANAKDAAIFLSNAVVTWNGEVTDAIDGTALSFDYVKRYIPISDTKTSLPYASNVTIPTENISLNDTLQVSYTYNCMENLPEAGTEYKWLRTDSLTEKDWEVVETGTTSATAAPSYTIGEEDLACYLVCAIKVKNSDREGQYIYSNVIEVDTPQRIPEVKNQYLYGDYRTGGIIYGNYEYFDINKDEENGSTYTFQYADSADAENWTSFATGTAVGGQEIQATIPQEALNKYIKMTVIPRNNASELNVGTEASTNCIGPIVASATQDTILRTSTVAADDYEVTSNCNLNISKTGALNSASGYYWYNGAGSEASHNVELPNSSLYRVYVYNPLMHESNDNNIIIEVNYAGGKTFQKTYNGKTTPAGWIYLGDFPFVKEQPAVVTLKTENGGNARLDSVKFVNVSTGNISATNLSISGDMVVNHKISANYTLSDGTEGNSTVMWYSSGSADGPWEKIGEGSHYSLTEEETGKYIKYTVAPVTSDGREGKIASFISTGTVATNIHYYTSTIAADGYSVTTNGTLNKSYTGAYEQANGYYYIRLLGETASHNVSINQTGLYRVSLYNPLMHETNDSNTIVEVTYANGTKDTISFNGKTIPAGWIELGNYPFVKDQTAVVTLKVGTNGGNVRLDTVRFEYLGEDSTISAGNLSIGGTLVESDTITANYTLSGGTEGNSVVNWYSSDATSGQWKYIGTGTSYTLTQAEADKYIKFTVLPVDSDNNQGPGVSYISADKVIPGTIYYTARIPQDGYTVTSNKTFGTSTYGAFDTTAGYYYSGIWQDWMKQEITLPVAGTYKVSYYQPLAHANNTSNALIKVTHKNGSTENGYDFKTISGWIELGTYEFDTTAEILTTVGSNGNIRVDTVKFERVG